MKRLLLLTMLLVATATASAQAAVITRTYDVIGSNFSDGGIGVPPVDVLRISFTVSIDPTDSDLDYVVLPLVVNYTSLPGDITGTVQNGFYENAIYAYFESDSLFDQLWVEIHNPFGNPILSRMYYLAGNNYFAAQSLELVPEPTSLALLGITTLRRRRD